jgi:hypothetical protein
MELNIDRMNMIKEYLNIGAPKITFDMSHHLTVVEDTDPNECGTVCCIAGIATLLAEHGNIEDQKDSLTDDQEEELEDYGEVHLMPWSEVSVIAANWLGLDQAGDGFHYHYLFNPDHAPNGCTPQQAAAAVDNVINHYRCTGNTVVNPWGGIE